MNADLTHYQTRSFFRLPMKYCKTADDMSVIKISDLNYKLMDDITKPCYAKMKDS
ncbi:MAG: hypothetical protein Ta2E_00390 [Mycoplasmoidaceae bacterium]|nr:MAG: hypothetical protein Ta2E_00390 [Mycoplasmoidaceae bacterium]